MLTEERKNFILEALQNRNTVKSRDLMNQMNVSESTIRRDLQEMEEEGLLIRVHGGATRFVKMEHELDMEEKSTKNIHEKKLIAEYAASLVKEEEFIYIDAGTTTLEMIPLLKNKQITIITNSVHHAMISLEYNIQTIIIGGSVRQKTKASVGQLAINQIRNLFFDKAFMGVNGVHPKHGFMTADLDEAAIKSAAIKQAQQVYFMTDSTKFDKAAFSHIADIDSGVILTNHLDSQTRELYEGVATIKEVEK